MKYVRKALTAALGALIAGIGSAAAAGKLDWPAAGTALGVAIAAGLATWRIENARTPAPVTIAGRPAQ